MWPWSVDGMWRVSSILKMGTPKASARGMWVESGKEREGQGQRPANATANNKSSQYNLLELP